MRTIRSGRLFILLASLLLSLLYCPPVEGLSDDQAVFQYAGLLIAKGRTPYLDLFDHKPPLIYFLDYLALSMGSWGPWIINTLLVAGATLFFYERCREKKLPYPFILPLLFNLLIRNYLLTVIVGATRACTTIFLLIAFCVLLGRSRYKFFWLGLLAAATFLMQQEQLLPLLPFLAYAFIDDLPTPRIFFARLTRAAAGFLVILGPIILYFAIHHALAAFWRDAFLFNFEWYGDRRSLGEQFRATHGALIDTELGPILLICTTLAVTALLLRTKQYRLVLAALLATGLAFFPIMFSGRIVVLPRGSYSYFTPFSAVLPILAFTAWTATDHPFLRSRISQAVFGFLLCASMLYNAIQHATHLSLDNDRPITSTPEYQFLRSHRPGDYQLYVFGEIHWINVYDYFGILAPSPWIYHHFWAWYPRWDSDHRILMSIGRDLLSHHTEYVVDFSSPAGFLDPGAYVWWTTFLQQHYQRVPLPAQTVPPTGYPASTLWRLRPDAINIPLSADPPGW
jgi:hypothetical protein